MGDDEEEDDEESGGRDGKEIGGEDVVAHVAESEGEVRTHRTRGDGEENSNSVERPEIVILEGFPKEAERESLAVVHVAFGWVITENTVHHDDFFTGVEPAVF